MTETLGLGLVLPTLEGFVPGRTQRQAVASQRHEEGEHSKPGAGQRAARRLHPLYPGMKADEENERAQEKAA